MSERAYDHPPLGAQAGPGAPRRPNMCRPRDLACIASLLVTACAPVAHLRPPSALEGTPDYEVGAGVATLGVIAGIWAEKFDQLAAFQNFIIMPLSFLSGVFYSIQSLPPVWQTVSHLNPFFYLIDGFRYGFFGASDVPVAFSFAVTSLALLVLAVLALWMLGRGYKLRQ